MNGVCKITIALAGLDSRGRERNADGIRGIILTFIKAKMQEIYTYLIFTLINEVREACWYKWTEFIWKSD